MSESYNKTVKVRRAIKVNIPVIAGVIALAIVMALTVYAIGLYYFIKYEQYTGTASSDRFVVGLSETNSPENDLTRGTVVGTLTSSSATSVYIYNLGTNETDTGLFDIIIMSTSHSDFTVSSGTKWEYGMTEGEGSENYSKEPTGAAVFTGISCNAEGLPTELTLTNNGDTAENVKIAVVKHTEYNYFVGSFFEFKMASDEYYRNFGIENLAKSGNVIEQATLDNDERIHSFDAEDSYANVYITAPFTIDEAYVYNIPCFIDLLYSDIHLNENLTIKHGYSGLFAITTISGEFTATQSRQVTFDTPKAYYEVGNTADLIDVNVEFVMDGIDIDLTDNNNAAILTAIKQDALAYIQGYLKSHSYKGTPVNTTTVGDTVTFTEGTTRYYIASDLSLPTSYYNYGISYTYVSSLASSLENNGHVIRSNNNSSVSLTVTANYNSEQIAGTVEYANPYVHDMTVIGLSENEISGAYVAVLGEYVNRNQLSSGLTQEIINGKISYGEDIWQYTKDFIEDTGFNPGSSGITLSFDNHALGYAIVAASRTVEQQTSVLTKAEFTNSVTLKQIDGVLTIDGGYNDITYLTVQPPYFTADETDRIKFTKEGALTLYSKEVSIEGCSVNKRNEYLNAIASQIYIGQNDENIGVLNIRDDGTYIGSGASEILKQPTRISVDKVDGNYIGYSMYFLNETATEALAGIDAYIALNPTVDRCTLIDALLSNNSSDTALVAYFTYLGRENISEVSLNYNDRTLLGEPDGNCYFSYSDGFLTMEQSSFMVYDGTIVFVGSITYTDGEEYRILRTLYSPASGLGGTEKQYAKSNIFNEQFGYSGNWLTVGTKDLVPENPFMKVRSMEYTVTTDSGTVYNKRLAFATDATFEQLQTLNPVVTGESVCTYFDILWDSVNKKFVLQVSAEYVPAENSTVEVIAVVTDGSNDMTETYSFVINGIYKYKRDVNDIWIYLRMLQVFGNHDGYLFVDDVHNYDGEFDCRNTDNALTNKINIAKIITETVNDAQVQVSLDIEYMITREFVDPDDVNSGISYAEIDGETVYSVSTNHLFDLTGIEYAVNTESFVFDELTVLNLTPFGDVESSFATSLSMKDCGITSSMLQTSTPLYKLNRLINVNLSENDGITSLSGNVLYRTVENLNVSNCSLTVLDGIESLVNMRVLNISSNAVLDFYPLVGMSSLTDVYLGGNPTSDADLYYGTHGKINLCNIVALIHMDVDVYVENDVLVEIYEKHLSTYYYEGEMTAINDADFATNETMNNILSQSNAQDAQRNLITVEQEYLAVITNAYFNFKDYQVTAPDNVTDSDSDGVTDVIEEMFPGFICESETDNNTRPYTVSVTDITGNTTAQKRTYIFSIVFDGTNANYRYYDNYTGVNGSEKATVYRQITFNVTRS